MILITGTMTGMVCGGTMIARGAKKCNDQSTSLPGDKMDSFCCVHACCAIDNNGNYTLTLK